MKGFIEITDLNGRKRLINISYIIEVSEAFTPSHLAQCANEFRFTQIDVQGNHFPKTYARLEEVKAMIIKAQEAENA